MKQLTGEQQFLEEEKDIPRLAEEYHKFIVASVEKIAEIAFMAGIGVPELTVKASWWQQGLPYGNRHIIPGPEINSVETDFGTIKIRKV